MGGGDTWVVVLAGGDGTRLADASAAIYGYPRPKQFCAFDGEETLLGRTLARAVRVVPRERIVVVTTRRWRDEARQSLAEWPEVTVLEQPRNAGTTAGLLFPLAHVDALAPDGTVVFLPSDHHVRDEETFAAALRRTARRLEGAPDPVVLLGSRSRAPEDGYGWIVPAEPARNGWAVVRRFHEKPTAAQQDRLWRAGALLNTFVLVARVRSLGRLASRHAPETWYALQASRGDAARLEATYARLEPTDFSRRVLERADNLRVVPIDAGWSDVGTPERLRRDLLGDPPEPAH